MNGEGYTTIEDSNENPLYVYDRNVPYVRCDAVVQMLDSLAIDLLDMNTLAETGQIILKISTALDEAFFPKEDT